jgi:hypothetical protein
MQHGVQGRVAGLAFEAAVHQRDVNRFRQVVDQPAVLGCPLDMVHEKLQHRRQGQAHS